MWVSSLGWEDPLEEGMETHSSILAWRIPWTEELSRLLSIGSQRVAHDRRDLEHTYILKSLLLLFVFQFFGCEACEDLSSVCVCVCVCVCVSLRPHGVQPTRLICHGVFQARILEWVCHFLLQGIFPTQRLNWNLLPLLHWQADTLLLASPDKPLSFLTRDQTHAKPKYQLSINHQTAREVPPPSLSASRWLLQQSLFPSSS